MERPDREDQSLNEAFARYVRGGNPDDLAEVFDRCAPRLALLAGHLLPGDRHQVEDLVQTTFLEAMRSSSRFTAGRRVLPWLVTILGRRAGDLRRRKRREAAVPLDPFEDELLGSAPDPSRLAADREIADHTAKTLARIDSPYREVLSLRLIHGLTAAEIARSLGRPLGTVHSQLHRGGEKLRGLLPKGIATALAGLLGSGEAMAQVRERVLAEAGKIGAWSAPATLAGTLIARLGLIAVTLFAVLGTIAMLRSGSEQPTSIAGRPIAEAAPRGTDTTQIDRSNEKENAGSNGLSDRSPSAAPIEKATFRGRVLTAEGSAPIHGAEVQATITRRGEDWEPYKTLGRTDASGRFDIDLDIRRLRWMDLRILAQDRIPMGKHWSLPLRAGAIVECGDIPMQKGVEWSLLVRDQDGAPVHGFEVQLEHETRRPGTGFAVQEWNGIQWSDSEGRIGPQLVRPGEWKLYEGSWTNTGHRVASEDRFSVPMSEGPVVHEILLETPTDMEQRITGRVVDATGRPIPVLTLSLQQELMEVQGIITSTTSTQDGAFFSRSLDPDQGPARLLEARLGRQQMQILSPLEPIALGVSHVEVVVQPIQRERVHVHIATQDGQPVEHFRHRFNRVLERERDTWLVDSSAELPASATFDGGLLEADLEVREQLLLLAPENSTLQPIVMARFHPRQGRVEVTVPDAASWTVQLRTADGVPVIGSEVCLLRRIGRGPLTPKTFELSTEGRRSASGGALVCARGVTDTNGRAVLRTGPDLTRAALRVRGAEHEELFVQLNGRAVTGMVRELTVAPAALLEGRLSPAELVAHYGPSDAQREAASIFLEPEQHLCTARIEAILSGPLGDVRKQRREQAVDDDGSFRFEALPSGDYELSIKLRASSVETPRQRLSLEGGQSKEIELDLRDMEPANLAVQVLLDGAAPPKGSSLRSSGASFRLDAAGRARDSAHPGLHRWTLTLYEAGTAAYQEFATPQWTEVLPGQDRQLTLHFRSHRFGVQLESPRGEPITGIQVEIFAETDCVGRSYPDRDGRCQLAVSAPGAYRLEVERTIGRAEEVLALEPILVTGDRDQSFTRVVDSKAFRPRTR